MAAARKTQLDFIPRNAQNFPHPESLLNERLMTIAADAQSLTARQDMRVIAAVGAAHFLSHFFQLAAAPMFPLIKDSLGVTYTALGFVMTLFYLVSGLSQAFIGIWVDRYGARPVLLGGLTLLALATLAAGFAPSYWWLVALAPIGGLGNSVFHPADLSILSSKVSKPRLGRAYGAHQFMGTVGYASAPIVMGAAGLLLGWQAALIAAGSLGLIAAAMLASMGDALSVPGRPKSSEETEDHSMRYAALVRSPAMLMGFAFFALAAMSSIGISSFSVTGLHDLFDIEINSAAQLLTAYLCASAAGILIGGWLADRTARHDLVAAIGIATSGLCFMIIAFAHLPFPAIGVLFMIAGVTIGAVSPSRDMLIKRAAPPGATGRVYGTVYSGLDLGFAMAAPIFGYWLDHGLAAAVFVGCAASLLVGVLSASGVGTMMRRRAK